jgi:uncharacterized protein YegJ (DUF2314 family)
MKRMMSGLLAGAAVSCGMTMFSMTAAAQTADPVPTEISAPVAAEPAPALPPAEPVFESTGDPALDAAIKAARGSLAHFWDHASKFPGQEHWHVVKIGLPATGGGKENVWIYTTEKLGSDLKGVIVTQPDGLASGKRKGDKIEFTEADILDWSYDEDGLRRGEFTKRAEFASMTAAEIAEELDYEGIHPAPHP